MERQKLQIANPCTEDFDAMEGAGAKRFCDQCDKHVHNLSQMTREEARKLIDENAESGLCVVYLFDANDRITFSDDIGARRAPRGQLTGLKKLLAAAALVPVLAGLPACDTSISEDPAVIEQPCDLANGDDTFRPIDEIREGEERFMQELRDFLGFTPAYDPDVELVMGAMPAEPPPEPDPEPMIMGEVAPEPTPAPVPEPAPEPEFRKVMGDVAAPPVDAEPPAFE